MDVLAIPFNNLATRHAPHRAELDAAIARVLDRGYFILGPELEAFEQEFADWHDGGYCAGVANGTDAIELALRAANLQTGDEVITVAHTAVATIRAIERANCIPILADVDLCRYTLDPGCLESLISARTRAILVVHLYGQPADMPAIQAIASRYGLLLLEDCAQAHGATLNGQKVGTWGNAAAYSFYPTKNLGALGDAGAVFSRDENFIAKVKRLRNYGQIDRYRHEDSGGINSRLDEIQAAVLRVGLKRLAADTRERRRLADCYNRSLNDVVTPTTQTNCAHVYHLYVIRTSERERYQARLKSNGIGTLIHYPVPVHRQPAFRHLNMPAGSLPVTEKLANEILSLPLYPGIAQIQIEYIINVMNSLEWKRGAA